MVRQEHQHPHPVSRLMGVAGPGNNRPRVGTRPTAEEDLRGLRALHRRLPNWRDSRPIRGGQYPLHLLPDDREPGGHTIRDAAAHSGLGIRLRHLPGRLPRQPQGIRGPSADSNSRSGWPLRGIRFGGVAGSIGRGVSQPVPGHLDHAGKTGRAAEERLCCAGKQPG